jgi:hypothetical protein
MKSNQSQLVCYRPFHNISHLRQLTIKFQKYALQEYSTQGLDHC